MKKIVITVVMCWLVSVSLFPMQKVSLNTSIIPADADWVIHLNMRAFATTRISDLLKNTKSHFARIRSDIQKDLNIDILKDIKDVFVFGTVGTKSGTVACLQGNLNKEYLLSQAKKSKNYQKDTYGKYTIHSWGTDENAVFLGNDTLLFGNGNGSLHHVLDVVDGKAKNFSSSEMMAEWKNIPNEAFLKAVASKISDFSRHQQVSTILNNATMVLFLAQEQKENLKMNLDLTTDTPEAAKNIHQIVNGFTSLIKLNTNDEEDKFWIDMLEKVKIHVNGNHLHCEFIHPSVELVRFLSGHAQYKK